MTQFTDQTYLKSSQYKDASNLDARIQLHRRFTVIEHEYHRWAFDLMLAGTPTSARVLEVGSGSAELWVKNQDRIPAGWQITLSDFSTGMLADGKAKLGDAASRFEFREVDVQAIPFEDHTFDLVIANFMLYHAPDCARAIAELRRVLKPSGSVHAATLGTGHMREYKDLLNSLAPELEIGFQNTQQTFSLENGENQLQRSFGDVLLLRHANNLLVTKVEPLLDYVRSLINIEQMPPQKLEIFRRIVQAEINAKGAFRITKESGTFIARGFAEN